MTPRRSCSRCKPSRTYSSSRGIEEQAPVPLLLAPVAVDVHVRSERDLRGSFVARHLKVEVDVRQSSFNVWAHDSNGDYVFNGISGALLVIPSEKRHALEQFIAGADTAECDYALLHEMAVGHMIVPDEFDEVEFLRTRYVSGRDNTSTLGLTIVTSLGCNFACPYCFEQKTPSVMAASIQDKVIELVESRAASLSGLAVTWFGGEPLLGKRVITRMTEGLRNACSAHGLKYSAGIITNGHLLDRATAKLLRECQVTSAQVTLDGPPLIHDKMRPLRNGLGTFDKILANIVTAVDYLNVDIRMNLALDNQDYYRELMTILDSAGLAGKVRLSAGHIVLSDDGWSPASRCQISSLSQESFSTIEQEFNECARQMGFEAGSPPSPKGAPCTAVRHHDLVIGSRGELYKCWDDVGNPVSVIGNIATGVVNDERALKWANYDPFSNVDCRACIALPVCMGGCAHHAMQASTYESKCGTFRYTHTRQVQVLGSAARAAGMSGLIDAAALRKLTANRSARPIDLQLPNPSTRRSVNALLEREAKPRQPW